MKSGLYGPPSRVAVVHPVRIRARLLGEALVTAGHRVKVLLPGPDALAEIEAHRADLVVAHASLAQDLDPDAPGLEVPVVSLTEGGAAGDQLAADVMLREPVDLESLRISVGGLLKVHGESRRLRRRVDDLGALYRLSWAFSLEGGPSNLFGYISERAAEMVGAQKGLVLLYDHERRQLTAQADGFGIPAEAIEGLSYAADGEASERWNFRTHGPLTSVDAPNDTRMLTGVVRRLGVRSVAAVPMTSGHRIVGLLAVADRPGGRAFDDQDTSLLLAAASLAAVAIENLALHDRVKKANATLEEYDRLKTQFVGMVAHDFRRPLTAIRGFAELVLVDRPPGDVVDEYMRGIVEECDGLSRLADDTLLLAKLETASVEYRWAETDLAEMVRETAPESDGKHRFVLEVPEGLPTVVVDGQRLRQVLSNLITNAVKYSPDGGKITIRCRVGDEVTIEVSDEGLGVPQDQQAQIFEKFHRVDSGQHRAVSGTGLGLYICRLIVEGHGGRVWVESDPGRGSRFIVQVPLDARPGRSAPLPPRRQTGVEGPITQMFRPATGVHGQLATALKAKPTRRSTGRVPVAGRRPVRVAPLAGPPSPSEPDDSQTSLTRHEEHRGSRRIRRMIPIRVNHQGATLTTYTNVINRAGALIICAVPIEPGTILQITNLVSQKVAPFEVIRRGGEWQGQYELGVQLREDVDFWGETYDPDAEDPEPVSRRGADEP